MAVILTLVGCVALGNVVPQSVVVFAHDTEFTLQKGQAISWDTGVKASDLQAVSRDGTYTLKFGAENYFNVYPSEYEATILLGQDHDLCSSYKWATQHFIEVTITCSSPGYIVFDQWPDLSAFDPNAHLFVSFSNVSADYWPLNFKNISLTFTPTD